MKVTVRMEQVAEMRYEYGMSIQAISEALDIGTPAVYTHLMNWRKRRMLE